MPEDLKGRSCANCAASYLILPPDKSTGISTQPPQRVCRLNPPTLFPVEKKRQSAQIDKKTGRVTQGPMESYIENMLTQQPVGDLWVCWQWKAPGTLPGDCVPQLQESALRGSDSDTL